MTGIPLPASVAELVDLIAAMPGTVAVVLGGSRARSSDDAMSDWDLGLYYRRDIDLSALATRGVVHPPGSWGRVMNGGAWLDCDGLKVDVRGTCLVPADLRTGHRCAVSTGARRERAAALALLPLVQPGVCAHACEARQSRGNDRASRKSRHRGRSIHYATFERELDQRRAVPLH
jgi:hypothetical protein